MGEAQSRHQAHTDTRHLPPRGSHTLNAKYTDTCAHVEGLGTLLWYMQSKNSHKCIATQTSTDTHPDMRANLPHRSPHRIPHRQTYTIPETKANFRAHPWTQNRYSSTNSKNTCAHIGRKMVSKCHTTDTWTHTDPQTHGRHILCV